MVSSKDDVENGYILTVVYKSDVHKSEVWIHDSKDLKKGPLCKIALAGIIPPGFHGKWKSAE
eukprot:CAMPEP_0114599942 /NCGR_PEP_ID=MMETSP0125-20121206/22437_1 /TAXON_ID=485358 ORGANISM="Aristerostoma sp., Strain ATCC 50986" /NCGR_SAMPLE_ID=MMETSP0125 /ASSEMBLY_ACC=CAM_ASM_000245 /LENGTH=61 /DNA_ID=CAMNT_0001807427 /DNA_START=839 /DNA_END=1024 /DNA_ORIENTATION=-